MMKAEDNKISTLKKCMLSHSWHVFYSVWILI